MLTDTQEKVLRFIAEFSAEHGYAPSYREIMVHMGYTSTNGVACHIKSLRKKGYLQEKPKHTARSMIPTNPGLSRAERVLLEVLKLCEDGRHGEVGATVRGYFSAGRVSAVPGTDAPGPSPEGTCSGSLRGGTSARGAS